MKTKSVFARRTKTLLFLTSMPPAGKGSVPWPRHGTNPVSRSKRREPIRFSSFSLLDWGCTPNPRRSRGARPVAGVGSHLYTHIHREPEPATLSDVTFCRPSFSMHGMAFSCIEICRAVEVPRLQALRAEYLLSLPVGRSISMHGMAFSCIEICRAVEVPRLRALRAGYLWPLPVGRSISMHGMVFSCIEIFLGW